MTKKRNTSRDYEVGRGKPPKAHQFVKGRSGNPGGRKKGSQCLKTILMAVAESETEFVEMAARSGRA